MNARSIASNSLKVIGPVSGWLAAVALAAFAGHASAQAITIANPNWNITLSDYGYSDFLLDNTPGFQGREYLSGEWGAAVGYQIGGGTTVTPRWLEPNFAYPDWATNSSFHVVTPISQTGLNADSLPIAQSVIANDHLEITLRHEMVDTVVGTPMGASAASAVGTGASINSGRYVLKQTATIQNISGSTISNLQFFQLLHGLQSQKGVYDNRAYTGPLAAFRYDVTMAGVDSWAVGPGSSSAGLEDFIGFHANTTPSGYEIGHYGVEGNGVDNHSIGKPSEGVHLSIENNWQDPPYSARMGTDAFAPAQRWIAGTERWNLGSIAPGQSVSHEVVLSLVTGTKVVTGTGISGGCNGGSSVPGGLDYQFDDVTSEGSCFEEFSKADDAEIAVRIAAGEFTNLNFLTPGSPTQLWSVGFSGTFTGMANLTFAYDASALPPGFDESTLAIHHFSGGAWQTVPGGVVDPVTHTITLGTGTLGAFALGVQGGTTYQIDATVSPTHSGTVTGTGIYPQAAELSLVAVANSGYVFLNWTEGTTIVSTSPSYTFAAQTDHTLVANFVSAGTAKTISTVSSPSNGGTTSGDGAYANGSSATVNATANPGYKFSKWMVGSTTVSANSSYTFTVSGDRTLVAKFKPIYTVSVICDPATADGEAFEAAADTKPPAGYELGAKATVKVESIVAGYSFVNWSENGVVVSTTATFGFSATANRDLVAHFAQGHRIDLSADPKTAGTTSGGGVHADGNTVTLLAEPKPGYLFTEWTEGGIMASTSASYSFTSNTDRTLVANFIALPSIAMRFATPGILTVSWPAGASGWVLEESLDLSQGSWEVSTRPIVVVGSENQVQITTPTGATFFRLAHP